MLLKCVIKQSKHGYRFKLLSIVQGSQLL